MDPIQENPDLLEVDEKREYVCARCNLVHWKAAPAPCDR